MESYGLKCPVLSSNLNLVLDLPSWAVLMTRCSDCPSSQKASFATASLPTMLFLHYERACHKKEQGERVLGLLISHVSGASVYTSQ